MSIPSSSQLDLRSAECPVCFDPMNEAYATTECETVHTFCKGCFEGMPKAETMNCPLCRGKITVIKKNNAVSDILEEMGKFFKGKDPETKKVTSTTMDERDTTENQIEADESFAKEVARSLEMEERMHHLEMEAQKAREEREIALEDLERAQAMSNSSSSRSTPLAPASNDPNQYLLESLANDLKINLDSRDLEEIKPELGLWRNWEALTYDCGNAIKNVLFELYKQKKLYCFNDALEKKHYVLFTNIINQHPAALLFSNPPPKDLYAAEKPGQSQSSSPSSPSSRTGSISMHSSTDPNLALLESITYELQGYLTHSDLERMKPTLGLYRNWEALTSDLNNNTRNILVALYRENRLHNFIDALQEIRYMRIIEIIEEHAAAVLFINPA